MGMIHQLERLSFCLKSGHATFCVHSQFKDFESDSPANRLLLFSHVNHAAASLADLLQQFVSANSVTWLFADTSLRTGFHNRLGPRVFPNIARPIVWPPRHFY